jgi:hypothetical protein
MSFTFYGQWSLTVIGNIHEFLQRVVISGSIANDGPFPAPLGAQIANIDGASWQVSLERSADGGATWQENLLQSIPGVTPQQGLIVTLYGDDSVVPAADSDITVVFQYMNPVVNPPGAPPYPYTLPPGSFRPPRPCLKLPGCGCTCCCQPKVKLKKPPCTR